MVQHATSADVVPPADFLDRMVEEGRYATEQDVILAGLRQLMDYIDRLGNLEREIQKGIDSGPGVEIDLGTFLAERRAAHGLSQAAPATHFCGP